MGVASVYKFDKVGINVLSEELEECAKFCQRKSLGVEVTAFADPQNLDERFDALVERHRLLLSDIDILSLHGPFMDLVASSADSAIVEVCARRHHQGLRAAELLDAPLYVAHLNWHPQVKNLDYRGKFITRSVEFWLPLADIAANSGITIVLENMWEPSPSIAVDVLEQAGHEHLRASFDNGHALVFSQVPGQEWVQALTPFLAHCHLHDNDGEFDQHLPIGKGYEDWASLYLALEASRPTIILESDKLAQNAISWEAAHRALRSREF
jgi:sugar phosphate isomerase/epimerase